MKTSLEYSLEVANIILKQIIAQDRMALPEWGAREYLVIDSGLQFRIKTPLYKRGVRVSIKLISLDTYDIEITRVSGDSIKVLNTVKGVYCDMLIEVINSLIEKDVKEIIFVE